MSERLSRTALFVPATRIERIPKALSSGADAVIVDLEDAVAPSAKAAARDNISSYALCADAKPIFVRINDATTEWFSDDLALCARLACVRGVVLPKAESEAHTRLAANIGKPVIPIIESARGVANLAAIAAVPGVQRLAFGTLDFMLDVGVVPDTSGARMVLDHVRCHIVLQSRLADIEPAWDGVHTDIADAAGLERAACKARESGFAGLLCIHPAQISTVHRVFAPSPQEVEWAQRILQKAKDTGSAAFSMDGKMVDTPVIERARKIIEYAASLSA
jgi:(S)-citramalyl-CoA lyase